MLLLAGLLYWEDLLSAPSPPRGGPMQCQDNLRSVSKLIFNFEGLAHEISKLRLYSIPDIHNILMNHRALKIYG